MFHIIFLHLLLLAYNILNIAFTLETINLWLTVLHFCTFDVKTVIFLLSCSSVRNDMVVSDVQWTNDEHGQYVVNTGGAGSAGGPNQKALVVESILSYDSLLL